MSFRKFAAIAGVAAALSLGAVDAYARPGGGGSVGSRGARTYTAPPSTRTAPGAASPIERSVTQRAPASPMNAARPSSGFGRGLLGGLLGAGLIGLLLGHGLAGGLGGLMSLIGLLLQVGLVVLAIRFAINYFRRRDTAPAGAAPGGLQGGAPREPYGAQRPEGAAYAPPGGSGGWFGGGAAAPQQTPLQIAQGDYETFERRLMEVEAAFSSEDVGTLRRLCTPEVASYLEEEISDNASKGLVNRISDVRLLKGDLSEAWREPDGEYATVAMRFTIKDVMVEKASGRVVDGGASVADEVTELWTFRRQPGSDSSAWLLSALQQAA